MWQDDVYAAMTTKPWLERANYDACVADNTSGACEDTSGDTAATYCSDMTLNSYTDWRMPTKDELKYLYTSNQYLEVANIDLNEFYWTNNSYSPSLAYAIYIRDGNVYDSLELKNREYYIRCVRTP